MAVGLDYTVARRRFMHPRTPQAWSVAFSTVVWWRAAPAVTTEGTVGNSRAMAGMGRISYNRVEQALAISYPGSDEERVGTSCRNCYFAYRLRGEHPWAEFAVVEVTKMPCYIHGYTSTGRCTRCGKDICSRCMAETGSNLCPHCRGEPLPSATPSDSTTLEWLHHQLSRTDETAMHTQSSTPATPQQSSPGAELLRDLEDFARRVTQDVYPQESDIRILKEQYRQVAAWKESWLRYGDQPKEVIRITRSVGTLGLFAGIRGWFHDWRIASRLIDESGRAISSKRIALTKALLAQGESEVSTDTLADVLGDYFKTMQLADTRATVIVDQRTAYIRVGAPMDNVPRIVATVKRTRRGQSIVQRPRPLREVNREYRGQVTEFARHVIQLAFASVPGLDRVAVSFFSPMVHQTLGQKYWGCVLAVLADRATWDQIVHANVSAENALRNFDFHFRPDDNRGLLEVPAMPPPSSRPQDEKLDLIGLDPLKFEELVKDLLSRLGYVAHLTKASHDGGIDIEAVNPQPIVGGKVVVQCKRYAGLVGAPVVRDLYGVVHSEHASKGILVTTSDFSADAYAFADGKPIELIDGKKLSDLLRQLGFPVN